MRIRTRIRTRARVRTRARARPSVRTRTRVRTRRMDPPGSEANVSNFLEEENGSCVICSIFGDKCKAG